MKKILFRKLLLDCLTFFLVALVGASLIIWVFQAVNFLDIMVEDGRNSSIYIQYTLLNFPKITSKILPFALFFSFTYVLARYEIRNELIIFWNFGIHKIELINFLLRFSLVLMMFQIILTSLVVPASQNLSRSLIKTSNVDFFESFVKPKKFNDNIKGLTIYADQKNKEGDLKNIYLKKDTEDGKFQITFAKRGNFKTINQSKILVLFDGETINGIGNKITNFSFTKSDYSLSLLESDVVTTNKIQETSTKDLVSCLKKYFNKNLKIDKKQKEFIDHNCSLNNLNNVFKELYKRFIIPFYIPILILISLILLFYSKENINYTKLRTIVFLIGFFTIIFSETTLKFIEDSFYDNFYLVGLPIITLIMLYSFFSFKLSFKLKKEMK